MLLSTGVLDNQPVFRNHSAGVDALGEWSGALRAPWFSILDLNGAPDVPSLLISVHDGAPRVPFFELASVSGAKMAYRMYQACGLSIRMVRHVSHCVGFSDASAAEMVHRMHQS